MSRGSWLDYVGTSCRDITLVTTSTTIARTLRSDLIIVCAVLLVAVGCAGRYVGPGSGTREQRQQQREQQQSESTDVVDPEVTSPRKLREIDASGLPVAP